MLFSATKYQKQESETRRRDSIARKEHQQELLAQRQEDTARKSAEKQRNREEYNAMRGLNLGNYRSDHSGYGEALREQISKKKAANSEKTRLELEEEARFRERRAGSEAATGRKEAREEKAVYRRELDAQVESNRRLVKAKGETGVSLVFGEDRVFGKEAYRRELDLQVELKEKAKKEREDEAKKEEGRQKERREGRVQEEAEEGGEKRARETYRRELDVQKSANCVRREEEERLEKRKEMEDKGLPLGEYNPDYREYLKRELGRQVNEKEEAKEKEKKEKREREELARERERVVRLSNMRNGDERREILSYREELDIQNAGLKELRRKEQERDLDEERRISGLPLGLYSPDYREVLRRGLDTQVEEKRERTEKEERERLKKERDMIVKLGYVDHINVREVDREMARELREGLDEQTRQKIEKSKDMTARDREEERKLTGLPLGLYRPDHREELRRGLDSQLEEKREREASARKTVIDQEKEWARRLNSVERDDPASLDREVKEGYRRDLDLQSGGNREVDRLKRELERLEELNNTGLNIGDYKPYDREVLKSGLLSQMEEKKKLEEEMRNRDRYEDRERGESIRRSGEEQWSGINEEKEQWMRDLNSQINDNRESRESLRARDRKEARESTGLPLGMYRPDHGEELRKGLDSQLEEKREREVSARKSEIDQEKRLLEAIRSVSQPGEWSDRWGTDLLVDLKRQMDEEKARRLDEVAHRKMGDSGIGIGNYKGYDKRELYEAIERQIEEKRSGKKKSRVGYSDLGR